MPQFSRLEVSLSILCVQSCDFIQGSILLIKAYGLVIEVTPCSLDFSLVFPFL